MWRRASSEATFARAFEEFAKRHLAERVHEALLIKEHLGDELIGHSHDGTAIEARERPATISKGKQQNQRRSVVVPGAAKFVRQPRHRPFIASASRRWRI